MKSETRRARGPTHTNRHANHTHTYHQHAHQQTQNQNKVAAQPQGTTKDRQHRTDLTEHTPIPSQNRRLPEPNQSQTNSVTNGLCQDVSTQPAADTPQMTRSGKSLSQGLHNPLHSQPAPQMKSETRRARGRQPSPWTGLHQATSARPGALQRTPSRSRSSHSAATRRARRKSATALPGTRPRRRRAWRIRDSTR